MTALEETPPHRPWRGGSAYLLSSGSDMKLHPRWLPCKPPQCIFRPARQRSISHWWRNSETEIFQQLALLSERMFLEVMYVVFGEERCKEKKVNTYFTNCVTDTTAIAQTMGFSPMMTDELDPCINSVKLWSNATLRMVEVKTPDEIESDR